MVVGCIIGCHGEKSLLQLIFLQNIHHNCCKIFPTVATLKWFKCQKNLFILPGSVDVVGHHCKEGQMVWTGPSIQGKGHLRARPEVIQHCAANRGCMRSEEHTSELQ